MFFMTSEERINGLVSEVFQRHLLAGLDQGLGSVDVTLAANAAATAAMDELHRLLGQGVTMTAAAESVGRKWFPVGNQEKATLAEKK